MHPSKFFAECGIKTGFDTVETFDVGLQEKMKNVHPKHFLKAKIKLHIYQVTIEYQTRSGNHEKVDRYVVMDNDAEEFVDFWIDMAISDYNSENPQHPMLNAEVMRCERIGDAVLQIGEDKKSTLRPLR